MESQIKSFYMDEDVFTLQKMVDSDLSIPSLSYSLRANEHKQDVVLFFAETHYAPLKDRQQTDHSGNDSKQ